MKQTILLLAFILQNFVSFSREEKYVELSDAKIHYKIFGKGNPILIINGGPGMSSEGFVHLAEQLSKNHQTIIYDQRGTGLSKLKTLNGNITMDLMVDDIESLRKHLKIENWVVMGHSFGGMLAYYYASKHPDCVKAMIQSSSGGMDLDLLGSINITSKLSRTENDSLNYYNSRIAEGDTTYKTLLGRGRFLAPAYLYNKKYVPIIAERLTQGNSAINNLVWANLRSIRYDVKEEMKSFHKPVLILHGSNDIVAREVAETAQNILPNSRLIILQNTSHYGWLEQPKQYFGEIESFLESNQL